MIATLSATTIESPVGVLRLYCTDQGLSGLYFEDHKAAPDLSARAAPDHPILLAARHQLEEYFSGQRQRFELPLDVTGTHFQRRVWTQLLQHLEDQ